MKNKKNEKGFSTLDLAFYIICVALLVWAGWPKVSVYLDKGKRAKAISEISILASAVSQYRRDMGNYPVGLGQLTNTSPYGVPWLLQLTSVDPWGTTTTGINGTGTQSSIQGYAYAYTIAGFAIWSIGKNKANDSGGSGSSLPTSFGGDDVGILGQ